MNVRKRFLNQTRMEILGVRMIYRLHVLFLPVGFLDRLESTARKTNRCVLRDTKKILNASLHRVHANILKYTHKQLPFSVAALLNFL